MYIYVLCASDEPLMVRYVGKTINSVQRRVREHLTEFGAGTRKLNWIEEVAARGAAIEWFVVETVVDDLDEAERRWIAYYPAGQLTNSTPGGEGWKHTEETRARMRASSQRGSRLSEEHKAKISAAMRGYKVPKKRVQAAQRLVQ